MARTSSSTRTPTGPTSGAVARSAARSVGPAPDPVSPPPAPLLDAMTIGRRIRSLRQQRHMTLDDLGSRIGRAASQVSVLENGRREPKLSSLQAIAAALDVTLPDLLSAGPLSHREELEVGLERYQRSGAFAALGVRPIKVSRSLPTEALEMIMGLQHELERIAGERAATPEEARRANADLRTTMRARDNYFPEIEAQARDILSAVGHSTGPLSQRVAADVAAHLGFSLHYVADLPHSTRSVTDLVHHRIYLPQTRTPSHDPRSPLLQALASHVLGHGRPADYGDFLRQRVETNYLAAALMLPEAPTVELLLRAKAARQISVEDLRDAFAVSYETAAHRFTNLVTRHLGIPVHFLKVQEGGTVSKAYENDGLHFPTDTLGSIEGQPACRRWAARRAFTSADRFGAHYQYTDTPWGTYWCTARTQGSDEGESAVSIGVPYAHVKWFTGRETVEREQSQCPDKVCCRRPPPELDERWSRNSRPNAKAHTSILAALPRGAFPGVDTTEVYSFLDRNAPADGG